MAKKTSAKRVRSSRGVRGSAEVSWVVRTPRDLKDRIEETARSINLSRNQLVLYLLTMYVSTADAAENAGLFSSQTEAQIERAIAAALDQYPMLRKGGRS